MIDYAKRLRAPALVAVVAVIGLLVVVSVGYFVVQLNGGQTLPAAARMAGATSPSLIWIFAAVALALGCALVAPMVPRAGRLVNAAAVVVGVATGVALVFWVIGLFGGLSLGVTLGALGGLVETAFKAACAVVLWRLRRLIAADDQLAGLGPHAEPPSIAADVGQPPVWSPEQAIGMQWSRAGDAATGAPAPAPEPPPQPERRQLWSRGGIAPEQLPEIPWTTAAEAAGGPTAGSPQTAPAPEDRPGRPTPDWTPAPRPEGSAT